MGRGAIASWLTLAVPSLPVGSRGAILAAALITSTIALVCWRLATTRAARHVAPVSLLIGLPFAVVIIAATDGA